MHAHRLQKKEKKGEGKKKKEEVEEGSVGRSVEDAARREKR